MWRCVVENPAEKAAVDVIVLSDSDDDESEADSCIQPVRLSNKRPVSAISSDSSVADSAPPLSIQSSFPATSSSLQPPPRAVPRLQYEGPTSTTTTHGQ